MALEDAFQTCGDVMVLAIAPTAAMKQTVLVSLFLLTSAMMPSFYCLMDPASYFIMGIIIFKILNSIFCRLIAKQYISK